MEIDHRIQFEEKFISEDNTTTLYFVSDVTLLKELVGDKYPEASGMTISVEYPTDKPEAMYCSVSISPNLEDEDGVSDYDWSDIYLPNDEIQALLELAFINGGK